MWYWNADNNDSFTKHKNMKIYIQKNQGDWKSVVEKFINIFEYHILKFWNDICNNIFLCR